MTGTHGPEGSATTRPKSLRERLSETCAGFALSIFVALSFLSFAPIPLIWFGVALGAAIVLLLTAHLLYPFRSRWRQYWVRRDPVDDPNHVFHASGSERERKKSLTQ